MVKAYPQSVGSSLVLLTSSPVAVRSTMQKIIALPSTEAKLIALVQCVQEMFFVKKIIESKELQVELPMINVTTRELLVLSTDTQSEATRNTSTCVFPFSRALSTLGRGPRVDNALKISGPILTVIFLA